MLRRVNRKLTRELIEKIGPNQPIAVMQENQWLPLTRDFNVGGDLVFPETNRTFRCCGHFSLELFPSNQPDRRYLPARCSAPLPRWSLAANAALPFRPCGHHLFSH